MRNTKIIVTETNGSFHATLENRPRVWGSGKTANEAIGHMVRYHTGLWNIVKFDMEQGRETCHVTMKNCPEVWGVGKTASEAVGQMICFHAAVFNVSVRVERQSPKRDARA